MELEILSWLRVLLKGTFLWFTKKHLRSYGCSFTAFTAAVNCTNPNTETQHEIIEIEITEAQIYFVIKQLFFCLQVTGF